MTLEHLDTIISFVAIITGVSLIVTTLTQTLSAILGLRGGNLFWGIKTLLVQVDPKLEPHADAIAQQILHHPLISDSTLSDRTLGLFARWKLASAIRKDELIEIVRMLANPAESGGGGTEPWRIALRESLDRLLPAKAEKLLVVLPEIQKLFPDDPAKVELVMAQLIPTAERLTAKAGDWFDSVMDRVSQRFAVHTRCWTVIFSVVIAFLLQLDAFKLFSLLSSDAELRARVVASADALTQKAEAYEAQVPQSTLRSAAENLDATLKNQLSFQLVPNPYPDPIYRDWTPDKRSFWGILASAALLSLGAPFWFNLLKTMSSLRPVIANKEKQERLNDEAEQNA
jgi:hypothetical protein